MPRSTHACEVWRSEKRRDPESRGLGEFGCGRRGLVSSNGRGFGRRQGRGGICRGRIWVGERRRDGGRRRERRRGITALFWSERRTGETACPTKQHSRNPSVGQPWLVRQRSQVGDTRRLTRGLRSLG